MLRITRRDFLKYCSVAAGALGLSASSMMQIENALAKDVSNGGIPVVWISGAACTGCTISLANSQFYTSVDDLLLNSIDLRYLDTLMATAGAYINGTEYAGSNSVAEAHYVYENLPYILAVEGAIPVATPLGGEKGDYCRIGDLTPASAGAPTAGVGRESMLNVTRKFASNANCLAVLAIGTCASFGGIPGARGNVADARGLLYRGTTANKGALNDTNLGTAISKPVINIPGCPPHPDWIVGTIAHVLSTLGDAVDDVLGGDPAALLAALPELTNYYRPREYGYGQYQCNAGPCPWRYNNIGSRHDANSGTDNATGTPDPDVNLRYPVGNSKALGKYKWGLNTANANEAVTMGCLGILGCKGRKTKADCSRRRWNTDVAEEYGVNWCVGSRGNCHGCTEPTFPDKVGKFYTFV